MRFTKPKARATAKVDKGRGIRGVTSGAVAFGLLVGAGGVAVAAGATGSFGNDQVDGTTTARGILLPSNQRVTPVGDRALINNGRLISSTLSADGTKMAAISWHDFNGFLTITDVKSGKVLQQVGTGTKTDPSLGSGSTQGQVGTDGPLYSADGKSLFFPLASSILRFTVNGAGTVAAKAVSIDFRTLPCRATPRARPSQPGWPSRPTERSCTPP